MAKITSVGLPMADLKPTVKRVDAIRLFVLQATLIASIDGTRVIAI